MAKGAWQALFNILLVTKNFTHQSRLFSVWCGGGGGGIGSVWHDVVVVLAVRAKVCLMFVGFSGRKPEQGLSCGGWRHKSLNEYTPAPILTVRRELSRNRHYSNAKTLPNWQTTCNMQIVPLAMDALKTKSSKCY